MRALQHQGSLAPFPGSVPAGTRRICGNRYRLRWFGRGCRRAWALAQRMATVPMIGYLGTIALSPVMRLHSLAQDTAVVPMLILLLVPSLIANFPDFETEALLTPTGMQCLENLPHAPRPQHRAIPNSLCTKHARTGLATQHPSPPVSRDHRRERS